MEKYQLSRFKIGPVPLGQGLRILRGVEGKGTK